MAKETVNLTAEELEFIQKGTQDFTKIKISLGDLELKKQALVSQAEKIMEAFSNNEKVLIEKYGPNAVINTQTGEVKQKEDGKN
jgi:phosphotransferase system IIB component